MASGEWCLIESDPGVFTDLIHGFGKSKYSIQETPMLFFQAQTEFKSKKFSHSMMIVSSKWSTYAFNEEILHSIEFC